MSDDKKKWEGVLQDIVDEHTVEAYKLLQEAGYPEMPMDDLVKLLLAEIEAKGQSVEDTMSILERRRSMLNGIMGDRNIPIETDQGKRLSFGTRLDMLVDMLQNGDALDGGIKARLRLVEETLKRTSEELDKRGMPNFGLSQEHYKLQVYARVAALGHKLDTSLKAQESLKMHVLAWVRSMGGSEPPKTGDVIGALNILRTDIEASIREARPPSLTSAVFNTVSPLNRLRTAVKALSNITHEMEQVDIVMDRFPVPRIDRGQSSRLKDVLSRLRQAALLRLEDRYRHGPGVVFQHEHQGW